jgi:uncharacterized protein (TIGR02246 family)
MKNQLWKHVLFGSSLLLGICVATVATSQESAPDSAKAAIPIENTIKQEVQSYAAAFNSKDADQAAAHWTVGGVYMTEPSGDQIVGREAIKQELVELFAQDAERQLTLETLSIELISPSVVLERGTATAKSDNEDPITTRYQTVYVQREGKWLIDRLTEDESTANEKLNEQLQPLQWIIGQWSDEVDGQQVNIECNWSTNKNFISRAYAIYDGDQVDASGLEIIGWDPKQKSIRSWLFDSEGAVVSGVWTESDDKWIVQSVANLPEGSTGSYTSIFRPLDGSYGWQKINQVVDGELLPNLDEIIISRKQTSDSE